MIFIDSIFNLSLDGGTPIDYRRIKKIFEEFKLIAEKHNVTIVTYNSTGRWAK